MENPGNFSGARVGGVAPHIGQHCLFLMVLETFQGFIVLREPSQALWGVLSRMNERKVLHQVFAVWSLRIPLRDLQ